MAKGRSVFAARPYGALQSALPKKLLLAVMNGSQS